MTLLGSVACAENVVAGHRGHRWCGGGILGFAGDAAALDAGGGVGGIPGFAGDAAAFLVFFGFLAVVLGGISVVAGAGGTTTRVEIERAWRSDIPRRLFDDASAAVTSTRLPVWSVVVLLRPGGRPPRGTGVYRIPGVGGDAFVFRYHVVPLWRLDAWRMRAELGLQGAPFCAAMHGADEAFVRGLADEVRTGSGLAKRERQSTMLLLYVVSAAILGSDTARRIFHVESIMQDPNVQELISEWEDKGRAEEARLLLHKVLAVRSFPVTPDVRARIDRERDVARLESWLEAAVTAGAIGDVFRDG